MHFFEHPDAWIFLAVVVFGFLIGLWLLIEVLGNLPRPKTVPLAALAVLALLGLTRADALDALLLDIPFPGEEPQPEQLTIREEAPFGTVVVGFQLHVPRETRVGRHPTCRLEPTDSDFDITILGKEEAFSVPTPVGDGEVPLGFAGVKGEFDGDMAGEVIVRRGEQVLVRQIIASGPLARPLEIPWDQVGPGDVLTVEYAPDYKLRMTIRGEVAGMQKDLLGPYEFSEARLEQPVRVEIQVKRSSSGTIRAVGLGCAALFVVLLVIRLRGRRAVKEPETEPGEPESER